VFFRFGAILHFLMADEPLKKLSRAWMTAKPLFFLTGKSPDTVKKKLIHRIQALSVMITNANYAKVKV